LGQNFSPKKIGTSGPKEGGDGRKEETVIYRKTNLMEYICNGRAWTLAEVIFY
jgi:hypothetical protein